MIQIGGSNRSVGLCFNRHRKCYRANQRHLSRRGRPFTISIDEFLDLYFILFCVISFSVCVLCQFVIDGCLPTDLFSIDQLWYFLLLPEAFWDQYSNVSALKFYSTFYDITLYDFEIVLVYFFLFQIGGFNRSISLLAFGPLTCYRSN